MIIKVELYYEITKKPKGPLPSNIRESVAKMVMEETPEVIDGFTDSKHLREHVIEVTRLSGEAIEKIRTGS